LEVLHIVWAITGIGRWGNAVTAGIQREIYAIEGSRRQALGCIPCVLTYIEIARTLRVVAVEPTGSATTLRIIIDTGAIAAKPLSGARVKTAVTIALIRDAIARVHTPFGAFDWVPVRTISACVTAAPIYIRHTASVGTFKGGVCRTVSFSASSIFITLFLGSFTRSILAFHWVVAATFVTASTTITHALVLRAIAIIALHRKVIGTCISSTVVVITIDEVFNAFPRIWACDGNSARTLGWAITFTLSRIRYAGQI